MTEESYAAYENWLSSNPPEEYENATDFGEASFKAGVEYAIDQANKAILKIWGATL